MDQAIRNKLRGVVTQCRKLLEESVSLELHSKFRIYAAGKDGVEVDDEARLTHLNPDERAARKDILDHFSHIKARSFKPSEALDQLVREIAFTHLNRLCAYKMMEARQVYVGGHKFREAVSRGVESNGVKRWLGDRPEEERLYNTGKQDVVYRHFLDWLGGLLSEEIGVLFNPHDSANRLYPSQLVLVEVLKLINDDSLADIWDQDESIGWVYQYFTPKELRDKAHKESQAPRNSYELAFRNQFFTPRYVVKFLTDNTLGLIWYEMRKGDTTLRDQCRYMVRRPNEVFLPEGRTPPETTQNEDEASQEELLKQPVHIPHRPKKDPRELRILDPACGSGHFLLYCFDLLFIIYQEAYTDPDLGPKLKADYPTLDALQRDIPRLILAHNLYAIDIDLRASQIAALALWLRCQRAYREMGLKQDRPKITKSNIVCAEPMPGENEMLNEFVAELQPKLLGHLVGIVFDKMKLAGEAGPLLKIEEELRDAIADAKQRWVGEHEQATDRKGHPLLFSRAEIERLANKTPQPLLFDFSEITDEQFWNEAETQVLAALRSYAVHASNGCKLKRQLFADDAVQGFAFIDICRKRFDVVLMNPPFGAVTSSLKHICDSCWDAWNANVLCAFFLDMWTRLDTTGALGAIFDRTVSVKSTYEDFRRASLSADGRLSAYVDLGWDVLDANVETAMAVITKSPVTHSYCIDMRSVSSDDKDIRLKDVLDSLPEPEFKIVAATAFSSLPNAIIGYDFPQYLLDGFLKVDSLEKAGYRAYSAHTLKAEKHNRVWWEPSLTAPPPFLQRMFNGSSYSPYSTSIREVAIAECNVYDLPRNSTTILRNKCVHGKPGVCFGKRSEIFSAHVAPAGLLFTQEGRPLPLKERNESLRLLALLNTLYCPSRIWKISSRGLA